MTQDNKLPILTRNERFRAVTLVWIYRWLWNDAQSLKQCRRGALLFFKVIHQISKSQGTKKSPILTRIERFRTVTPIWIHLWLWNNAQSLMSHRTVALLFFKVIHQISRSQETKNRQFRPELSVSGLQFEFTEGFGMMHKAWRNVEEVPYNFSRSSIKFQGQTGWKISDFNPIWVRLLGRSQLSNPSDLPCLKWVSDIHAHVYILYSNGPLVAQ